MKKEIDLSNLNAEQYQAVANSPVDVDVQLAAGAGSGKTKTLSDKTLYMVENGEFEPSQLLVLTFTNNAAHEMKERIIKNFIGSKYEDMIRSSHVQTFDSFAQDLVKAYSKELGISDKISVANQDVLLAKTNKLLDEILDEYYSDPIKKEQILETLIKFNIADDKKTKQVILDLRNKLDNFVYSTRDDFITNYDNKYLTREIFDSWMDTFIKEQKEKIILGLAKADFVKKNYDILIGESGDLDVDKCHTLFSKSEAFNVDYNKFYFNNDFINDVLCKYRDALTKSTSDFIREVPFIFELTKGALKNKKEIEANEIEAYNELKAIKDEISVLQHINPDIDYEYQKAIKFKDDIHLILEIVKELNHRLEEYKRTTNCFSFADIGEKAYRLLNDDKYKDVAEEVRCKFKYIMVDEYQDTNDIQEGVINSLLLPNKKGTRAHLFCVGDAKQSIYGFRNTKVELFRNRQELYKDNSNGHKVIAMNKNYRSGAQLLLDINYIFRYYMTLNHGGISFIDEMEQLKYDTKVDLYGREAIKNPFGIYRIVSKNGAYDFKDPAEWEALAIIKDIKDKMTNGFEIYDRGGKDHKVRKPKLSDFAIIMRTKKGFDLYQKLFNEFGIPLNNKLSTHLRELDAILVIQSLISLISYKMNNDEVDVRHLFASIARSYIYCYTDQQVFDALTMDTSDIETIEKDQIMIDINNFVLENKDKPFSQIFLNMLTSFGVISKLHSIGGVDDNIAKIESLYLMAVSQEASGEGLSDFVKLFKDISKYDLDLSSESTFAVEDAVDMMTIHASKGLERKICYMPYSYNSYSSGSGMNAPDYVLSEKYGIILPHYDFNYDVDDPSNENYIKSIPGFMQKDEMDKHNPDIDEHVRLFYVALTRAENRLYIVGDGPDYSKKDEDAIRKKEDLYSMLSVLPHYFDLDMDYINQKVKENIIDKSTLDNYLKVVESLKQIQKNLTLKDFNNELELSLYESLWNKYYFGKLSSDMRELYSDMRYMIFASQMEEICSISENSKEFIDYSAKILAVIDFNKDVDGFDGLLKVIEEHFTEAIKEEEEEEPINIDEDSSFDNNESKELEVPIDMNSAREVCRTFLNELISVYKDNPSELLDIPKSCPKGEKSRRAAYKFGAPLMQVFDKRMNFARISFKNEGYNDFIEVVDISSLEDEKVVGSEVKELSSKSIDNKPIEFKDRVKLRASKMKVEDEDNIQEIFSYGTYLHRLLELTDLVTKDTSFINKINDRKLIDKVLSNSIFDNLKEENIRKEYGYYDDLLGTSGFIDLLLIKDGNYYIIDYKSKHTGDDAYKNQLHTYQRNIQRLFNVNKDKIHLYLLSIIDNNLIEIDPE